VSIPLAAAIVHGEKERNVKLQSVADFTSVSGGGVIGKVDGREIAIGKLKFLQERGVTDLESVESRATALQAEGTDGNVRRHQRKGGRNSHRCRSIKPSTPEAIAQLHKLGLKIIMLTGDNERTANSVAKKLGLDQVEAGVEPQNKHERIQQLRSKDTSWRWPVMASTTRRRWQPRTSGIAMGTGTDVAMESAGITAVKGDLRGIVKAIA